jgi:hypothetical protein
MFVLIDSISEPLGVAEHPLDPTTDAASMHANDPTPRFNKDDMNRTSTHHRRMSGLGGQGVAVGGFHLPPANPSTRPLAAAAQRDVAAGPAVGSHTCPGVTDGRVPDAVERLAPSTTFAQAPGTSVTVPGLA